MHQDKNGVAFNFEDARKNMEEIQHAIDDKIAAES
jgi:hypothetical protein